MGWYTPLIVGMISMIIVMLTKVGEYLEDPFGTDLSDLPLQKYCKVIELQVRAIQNRQKVIAYDLAVGPVSSDDEENP